MRKALLGGALVLYAVGVVFLTGAMPQPQELPPPPNQFRGVVMLGDRPAPEGLWLYACVSDCAAYATNPVPVEPGGRFYIVVGPPSRSFFNRPVIFYLTYLRGERARPAPGDVRAQETAEFLNQPFREEFIVLHFPEEGPAPPPGTPTPTPTPTPALPVTGDTTLTAIPPLALAVGLIMVAGGLALLLVVRLRARAL